MFFVGVRGFFLGRGRGVGGRLREDGYRGFVADLLFVITCPFKLTLYSISMCSSVKPVKREGDIGGGVGCVCVVVVVFIMGRGKDLFLLFVFSFFSCFVQTVEQRCTVVRQCYRLAP